MNPTTGWLALVTLAFLVLAVSSGKPTPHPCSLNNLESQGNNRLNFFANFLDDDCPIGSTRVVHPEDDKKNDVGICSLTTREFLDKAIEYWPVLGQECETTDDKVPGKDDGNYSCAELPVDQVCKSQDNPVFGIIDDLAEGEAIPYGTFSGLGTTYRHLQLTIPDLGSRRRRRRNRRREEISTTETAELTCYEDYSDPVMEFTLSATFLDENTVTGTQRTQYTLDFFELNAKYTSPSGKFYQVKLNYETTYSGLGASYSNCAGEGEPACIAISAGDEFGSCHCDQSEPSYTGTCCLEPAVDFTVIYGDTESTAVYCRGTEFEWEYALDNPCSTGHEILTDGYRLKDGDDDILHINFGVPGAIAQNDRNEFLSINWRPNPKRGLRKQICGDRSSGKKPYKFNK